MAYVYDDTNIFARILRGEIPNKTVYETEHTLAFADIAPKAPAHVLVIPKGPYVTYDHFCAAASAEEIVDFSRAVAEVVKLVGAEAHSGGKGFRAITNAGEHGVQEVPHFHLHILAGRNIGPMILSED
ncbi:diadenosine tetraphosphate (Ap4A) HIT family hydrolase [Rhodobacter aestuarii]|uniref:Diadenosine tetraphosphate (Ap4A) hydrolase n=1 Tax=Rhodobacter aestuarii TaxID=453582 RepID=A0A1N7JMG7_9RHOB|nr:MULTISPECIES: HIT domain-containing protein [Rhodobacter]PTV96072.1 diadenosine tetraphosphate (Ap4A) HIT family hydrolase [Rhodobacter aestuarii]SIS50500.1 Diadenosine tetraphosphate (Ap4A) hydrolase [Rhodobacter aestuarii]SOC09915.1 diadenosine tetraphosphate (Ap4A) HIT family hydrolase [Rhodobacter sp. JA431]